MYAGSLKECAARGHCGARRVELPMQDYSVMRIDVASPGGHSSMPPVDGSSVAATLARMLLAVDRTPPCTRIQAPPSPSPPPTAAHTRFQRLLVFHPRGCSSVEVLRQLVDDAHAMISKCPLQSPTKEFLHAMAEVAPVRGARALLRLAHHW